VFTGIVEEVGVVKAVAEGQVTIGCSLVLDGTALGDSVNVNGCCLTVADRDEGGFSADLMRETLDRTALGRLAPGDPVNLERAVAAGGRLGGHLVQGHVDGVGEVAEVERQEHWTRLRIDIPGTLDRYIAEKGSIGIDGISLTVAALGSGWVEVGLIPHTLAATTLGAARPGDPVNIEVDVIAKYVERLLDTRKD
jgi:riboflavin synthase